MNEQEPPPPPNAPRTPEEALVHMVGTYRSLRRLLVVVALFFVFVLLAYRWYGKDAVTRDSISAYYHNPGFVFGMIPMRDLFVGSFASVALMLYAYRGVHKWESRLLDLAAIGLLVVAASPMEWSVPANVAEDTKYGLDRNRERMEFVNRRIEDGHEAKAPAKELLDSIGSAEYKAASLTQTLKLSKYSESQDGLPHTPRGWAHYGGACVFFFCIMLICWFHTGHTLKWIDNPSVRLRFRGLYHVVGFLMGCVPVRAIVLYLVGYRATIFWVELAGVGVFVLYWSIKSEELSRVEVQCSHHNAPTIQGM
jgi:hypothetical protein